MDIVEWLPLHYEAAVSEGRDVTTHRNVVQSNKIADWCSVLSQDGDENGPQPRLNSEQRILVRVIR